jgi:hypothetical protein
MSNTSPAVLALLVLSMLAGNDVVRASDTTHVEAPRAARFVQASLLAPALPAQPSLESEPLARRRELEQRGCAAVEHRIPLRGRLDSAVVRAARDFLDLPMGAARLLAVNGRELLFCLELHYHEPGYQRGPEGWHKGVTVYSPS